MEVRRAPAKSPGRAIAHRYRLDMDGTHPLVRMWAAEQEVVPLIARYLLNTTLLDEVAGQWIGWYFSIAVDREDEFNSWVLARFPTSTKIDIAKAIVGGLQLDGRAFDAANRCVELRNRLAHSTLDAELDYTEDGEVVRLWRRRTTKTGTDREEFSRAVMEQHLAELTETLSSCFELGLEVADRLGVELPESEFGC